MTGVYEAGDGTRIHAASRTSGDVLKGWKIEAGYARNMLMYPPGEYTPALWWEPHLVYVIHLDAEELFKVGLTRHNSRRLKDFGQKAPLVDSVMLANRWTARVVEVEVLKSMVSHRLVAATLGTRHGREECWDDSVAPPTLIDVLADLEAEQPLPPFWSTSVMTNPSNRVALSPAVST